MSTVVLLVAPEAVAAPLQVATRALLGANDAIDWEQVQPGPPFLKTQTTPFAVVSVGGMAAAVTSPGDKFWSNKQGNPWGGNFLPDERLIGSGQLFTTSPISITFAEAVRGVGTQMGYNTGSITNFTQNMRLYDASNTLIGDFSVLGHMSGAADGSAKFIGAVDTVASIKRVEFFVQDGANNPGYALNFLSILRGGSPTNQLAPNPNPLGANLIVDKTTGNFVSYLNLGTVTIIASAGTLMNAQLAELRNSGTISNSGSLINFGSMLNDVGALFNNLGHMDHSGMISNSGSLLNFGTILTNTGSHIDQNGNWVNKASIDQKGNLITGPGSKTANDLGGTWYVDRLIQNRGSFGNIGVLNLTGSGAVLENLGLPANFLNEVGGEINVAAGAIIRNAPNALFENAGTLNLDGLLDNKGNLTTEGFLNLKGQLENSASISLNNGKLTIDTGGGLNNLGIGGTLKSNINIDLKGILNNSNGASIDLTNGKLTIDTGGALNNNGLGAKIKSGVEVDLKGILNNSNGASVDLTDGKLTIDPGGALNNTGLGAKIKSGVNVDLRGILSNSDSATFDHDGGLLDVTGNGVINNLGNGAKLNAGSLSFTKLDGTLNNTGTTINSGTWTTGSTGKVTGNGIFEQTGGSLTNNGSMTQSAIDIKGGSFGGSGSITGTTTVSGGTLKPGNSIGTLNFIGAFDFGAPALFEVEVDAAGNADLIAVTGAATLSGGTVHILPQGGLYGASSDYTILTATTGVTGTFTGADPLAFFNTALAYQPNSVVLTLVRKSIVSVAQTPNQAAVATMLDGQSNALTSALLGVGTPETAHVALDSLSGEEHAMAKVVAVDDSRFVREAMIARTHASLDTGERGAWIQGFGALRMDDLAGSSPLSLSTGGMLFGADADLPDGWTVGVTGGLGHSGLSFLHRTSNVQSDDLHVGFYGAKQWDDFYLRFGGALAGHDLMSSRTVTLPGYTDTLTARYSGVTTQVLAEISKTFRMNGLLIEPFAGLTGVLHTTSAYAETGGLAALSSGPSGDVAAIVSIGVRASQEFVLNEGLEVEAHGNVAWRQAFGDLSATHALAGGAPFTVASAPLGGALVVELGADVALSETAELGVSYSGSLSPSAMSHGIKGTLSVSF